MYVNVCIKSNKPLASELRGVLVSACKQTFSWDEKQSKNYKRWELRNHV